jgi:hypothetical protein
VGPGDPVIDELAVKSIRDKVDADSRGHQPGRLTGSLRLSAMPASAKAPSAVIPVHITQDSARFGSSGFESARCDMAFLPRWAPV